MVADMRWENVLITFIDKGSKTGPVTVTGEKARNFASNLTNGAILADSGAAGKLVRFRDAKQRSDAEVKERLRELIGASYIRFVDEQKAAQLPPPKPAPAPDLSAFDAPPVQASVQRKKKNKVKTPAVEVGVVVVGEAHKARALSVPGAPVTLAFQALGERKPTNKETHSYSWREREADSSEEDAPVEGVAPTVDDASAPSILVSASEAGTLQLEVTYTHGDKASPPAPATAVFFSFAPRVAAVAFTKAREDVVEFKALGVPADEEGPTWALGVNSIGATLEGEKAHDASVRAESPGVVPIGLTYQRIGFQSEGEVLGAAAFVSEKITATTMDWDSSKESPTQRRVLSSETKLPWLLVGLANDPPDWRAGYVTLEAAGTPAEVSVKGLAPVRGAHEWKAKGVYLQSVNGPVTRTKEPVQADDSVANSKVHLRALAPARSRGPAPEGVVESVTAAYGLADAVATDVHEVGIARWGCSPALWLRRPGALDARDRPDVCGHGAAPMWKDWKGMEPPPDGDLHGGHQHGARCAACSGGATGQSPRDVYHWLFTTDEVLKEAYNLAYDLWDASRAFYADNPNLNLESRNKKWGAKLFTVRALALLQEGKMLGVLHGKGPDSKPRTLYALSSRWDSDGSWSPPADLSGGRGAKEFTTFNGTPISFRRAQAPFQSSDNLWKNLGRCAMTALLDGALRLKLTDLAVAEIWVASKVPWDAGDLPFRNGREVGSCGNCQRYLGAVLCPYGPR
jgi:hypothetical protein